MTQFSNMTNDNELTMDDMNYGIVKAHEQCEYIALSICQNKFHPRTVAGDRRRVGNAYR